MAEQTKRSRRKPPPAPPQEPEAARAPICSVPFCPICTVVTALGDARPEVTEHLLVAVREGLIAMRALIDARLEGAERSEDRGRIQRVEIV